MIRKRSAAALATAALSWSGAALGEAQLGSATEARAMLDHAVAALKSDRTAALNAFNDEKNKQFRDRDLYVYCFNLADGKFTAYEFSALIGADIRQFRLYDKPMGQRAYDVVHDAPEGAVVDFDYEMPKPGAKTPSPKEALEARVGDQACGVSYYK